LEKKAIFELTRSSEEFLPMYAFPNSPAQNFSCSVRELTFAALFHVADFLIILIGATYAISCWGFIHGDTEEPRRSQEMLQGKRSNGNHAKVFGAKIEFIELGFLEN